MVVLFAASAATFARLENSNTDSDLPPLEMPAFSPPLEFKHYRST